MVQAKTSRSHLGGVYAAMLGHLAIASAGDTQPGCEAIRDECLRALQSWRGHGQFLCAMTQFFGWDPRNSNRGAGDSDPELYLYTARRIDCALLV
jgi:hypothetical protein